MTTIILTLFHDSVPDPVFIPECLDAPALPAFYIFSFTGRGLASLKVRATALRACFLFPADKVILRIREKSRKTDTVRIRCGSIYTHRKPFTDARKYVPHPQTTERKSLGTLPREITQISHSDASGHNVSISGAARYFDYESAFALRTWRPPTAPICRATCTPPRWPCCFQR